MIGPNLPNVRPNSYCVEMEPLEGGGVLIYHMHSDGSLNVHYDGEPVRLNSGWTLEDFKAVEAEGKSSFEARNGNL